MLSSEVLISPILSLDALLIAGTDKTFNFYINLSPGPVAVASGSSFPQIITALTPTQSLLAHATQQFEKISQQVNLQFVEVQNQSEADIAFFFDSEIEVNESDSSSITLGLALSNRDTITGRQWVEIFFNGPEIKQSSTDLEAFVFNHELLHALGLEHTFDDSDGDFYLSTDPQLSATPEQTVMSYRLPASGFYPTDLTLSDYNALIDIWGHTIDISAQSQQTIYRLYQQSTGRHVYSSNQHEIDILTGSVQSDFLNEGIAYVISGNASQDLHRFYKPSTGSHFYTASNVESELLMASPEFGYLYEGVAYKVFSALDAPSGSTAVTRFFDPLHGMHFYTANEYEIEILQTTQPTWIQEGTAWYV